MSDTDIPPGMLIIDVAESALTEDVRVITQELSQLSETNIRIHIDDFGSGWSSLSLLKRLSVSAFKIEPTLNGFDLD
jgi:EAL domain-containing protein (putative c-di-GMP-specific phosphodiesterase class I)